MKLTKKIDVEIFDFLFEGASTEDRFGVVLAIEKSKFRFLRIEEMETIDIVCTWCRKVYYIEIDEKIRL